MPITTHTEVSSAKTAEEYATKFGLAASDKSVQWVKNHQKEYLELVRAKDRLAERSGIDPDKFAIGIHATDVPNMGAEINGAHIMHRYMNAPDPTTNPRIVNIILVSTGSFHPSLTAENREAFIAHEMGHQIKPRSAERNWEDIKQALGKNFNWFKSGPQIRRETKSDIFHGEEIHADKVGAQLLCNTEQMIQALKDLSKVELRRDENTIIKIDNMASDTHPAISTRINALKAADPEIRKGCSK